VAPTPAQDELGRVALDHSDYAKWNTVSWPTLSEDGQWAAFSIRPSEGAATLTIREVATQKQYTVLNGSGPRFSFGNDFVAYLVQPDPDLVKKLKKDKDRKGELPKSKLEILELENGRHVTLPDVRRFDFPEKAAGWIAYSPSSPKDKAAVREGAADLVESYAIAPTGLAKASPGEEPPASKSEKSKDADKDLGDVLVLRDLESGIERRFPDVTSHAFSKYGARLAFATSALDAEDDGVFVVDLTTGALQQILDGRGKYFSLAFSEDEQKLAFLSDREDFGPVEPSLALFLWTAGDEAATKIVDEETEALPEGWWIASSRPVFTEDGRRLLFHTQPKPEDAGKTKKELEKEKKAAAAEPEAKLDVWSWMDDALQPQQLLEAERERNRSYRALFDLKAQVMVQLATKDVPSVYVDARARGDVAVGTSSLKYATMRSWEAPGFSDSYLVDLNTGAAQLVLEKVRATASLSPGGAFVTWWDPELLRQFVMSTTDPVAIDVSDDIPTSLANELHDTPSPPWSYGVAGWLEGDQALLLYDRFDLWQVDPTGVVPAKCITGEEGRAGQLRYRAVRLDPEARATDPDQPMWLSVFDEATKASGYSKLDLGTGELTPLLMLDERVADLRKAHQGSTMLLTRQTFRRSPDLWATTVDFERLTRLSQANPQQRDYLWGTAELVHYETTDGQPMSGLLYKPDNFDASKKYPMMVSFYERSSDRLHRYYRPSAGGSSINYSFYVSRGYVLFVPDIPYETGHPGRSAANAVLPGIQSIVDRGFVDEARIGVQGHSWGGYQIAYLVTQTDTFACAEAGAPVSNMTSAYGGIRWGSGMSRMFQYEKTQSRIGGTLWDARELYIENSPVFFADQVETPLLMMHNDGDGAVPWYQGIEMFVALRRLDKPVWMLNYNGEEHGLRKKENRLDWAKRMQQFFDHYLMDGPATRWLAEGVPAVDKGKDLGLELVPAEAPAPPEAEAVVEEAAETPAAPEAEAVVEEVRTTGQR
jgi:dipeptidyl aminopeptidase/acylaminoacyl peptidase